MMAYKYAPIQHAAILTWINDLRREGCRWLGCVPVRASYNIGRINGSEPMARTTLLANRVGYGGLPGGSGSRSGAEYPQ